jgi:hypothetical protein
VHSDAFCARLSVDLAWCAPFLRLVKVLASISATVVLATAAVVAIVFVSTSIVSVLAATVAAAAVGTAFHRWLSFSWPSSSRQSCLVLHVCVRFYLACTPQGDGFCGSARHGIVRTPLLRACLRFGRVPLLGELPPPDGRVDLSQVTPGPCRSAVRSLRVLPSAVRALCVLRPARVLGRRM